MGGLEICRSSKLVAAMEEFDGINLLVVVIDVNPFVWAMAAKDPQRPVHFGEVMEHLTIFINAHLALRFDNKLAIVVSTVKKSEIIYTTDDVEDASAPGGGLDKSKKPPNVYKQFRYADDALMQRLKGLTKEFEHGSRQESTLIAGSISLALSYINRVKRKAEGTPLQGRILTISVSSDGSAQYIPMMNCIFAAQKFGIRIDICKVYGPPSVFLPQASAITLGVFYDVADAKNLITYLM
ncbi:RNA polymerase II transcription factor B subunit 4 [Irineochytrium annulatum]|nr:RNA polymerase II transcription factor B subunit 4 [Irineochytrium annulatum]